MPLAVLVRLPPPDSATHPHPPVHPVRRAKPGPKLKRAVSLPSATGDCSIVGRGDLQTNSLPFPIFADWDWESKVLEHLQSANRSTTLAEIILHFSAMVPLGPGPSERTNELLAQEIRQAMRSLGEKCCVFIEAGGRYSAAV
jgi:hypothetical protein